MKVFKKLSVLALSLIVLSGIVAPAANAATAADMQAQISALMAQINALNTQLAASKGTTSETSSYTFTRNLTVGSRGADVKALQEILIADGYLKITTPTTYFGAATKAALAKWQAANGVKPALGYFGAITRAAVNALASTTTPITSTTSTTPVVSTTSTTSVATGFNVVVSSDTPAAGSIVAGQAIADLGHFTFTNGGSAAVKVTSVKVHRIGVSSDNTLTNVYLYQGATKLTDAGSMSLGIITFSNPNGIVTIPAGGSVNVAVKADILAGVSGQTVGAQIAAASDVVTDSATVGGTFPLNSNLMSVANVSDLATAGFTASALGATTAGGKITAGASNVTIWSAPLNVSTRTVNLKYLKLRQVGSIPADALQNVALYINGSIVASSTLNANNDVIFDLSSNPFALTTGSKTVEVHADIVKGSSRTFSLSLQVASDITLVDTSYGANITSTVSGTASFPMSSPQSTVDSASVSIAQDPAFTTTQIVNNAASVVFGQYTMKAYGEDVRVGSLTVKPVFTGTAQDTEGFNNVAIYVNGAQVGTSQNYIRTSGSFPNSNGSLTFGSGNLFTIPAGTQVTVTIKGDNVLVSGTTITAVQATLGVPANAFQGLSSYATTPASTQSYAGQSESFVTGALTIAKNTGYTDQTLSPNVNKQKIGSFSIQASNAEAVRVTNLEVDLSAGVMALTNLANLYVGDNMNPVAPQSTNNFSVNFTIPAGGSKTVDVFADVATATGTASTSLKVTANGVSTNNSVGNATAVVGQTITVTQGTLSSIALDGSSKLSDNVIGGSTVPAATFKFVAANGNAIITELKLAATASTTSTTASTAITSVTIPAAVAGTTNDVSAPVVFNPTTGTYIAYLNGLNISVPAGTLGKTVTANVAYSTVGTNAASTNQQAAVVLYYAKYQIGTVVTTASTYSATSSLMTVVASKPSVAFVNDPASLASGAIAGAGTIVSKFTVSADNAGPVTLKQLAFTPNWSGTLTNATSDAVAIYDANDLSTALQNTATTSLTSGTQFALALTNEVTIPAGGTKTFVVKADTTGLTSTGNSFRMDITNTGETYAATGGAATNKWAWNDGTISGTYMNANLVKNLPITGNTYTR